MLRDGPDDASYTFLFAHGAGAGMDTEFMTHIAQRVAQAGVRVVRFEFPYMARRREGKSKGGPDRMPALEAAFLAQIEALGDPSRIVVGGKSMGGRVATRIADRAGVCGVVALGYPFHPPAKPQSLRIEHLQTLHTPCLIVQGTRDRFGLPEEVAGYGLVSGIELIWSEDGDHSLEPRKKSGRSTPQNWDEAADRVAEFIIRVGGARARP